MMHTSECVSNIGMGTLPCNCEAGHRAGCPMLKGGSCTCWFGTSPKPTMSSLLRLEENQGKILAALNEVSEKCDRLTISVAALNANHKALKELLENIAQSQGKIFAGIDDHREKTVVDSIAAIATNHRGKAECSKQNQK